MCLNIHPFLLDIPVHIQNIIHNVMLRQFIQISLLYTKFNFQSSAYFVYINRIETNKIETELKTNKQKNHWLVQRVLVFFIYNDNFSTKLSVLLV